MRDRVGRDDGHDLGREAVLRQVRVAVCELEKLTVHVCRIDGTFQFSRLLPTAPCEAPHKVHRRCPRVGLPASFMKLSIACAGSPDPQAMLLAPAVAPPGAV